MTIFVRSIGLLVLAVGLAVLAGYGLHLAAVITVAPGLQGMSPLTALMIAALAAGILADSFGKPSGARGAAGLTLIVAAAVLAAHAFAGRDLLSPAVSQTVFGYPAAAAGRTSIATAACAALLAAGVFASARPHLADGLRGLALLVAGMAVIGYAYGVQDLYAVPLFRTMALHTALAILSLSAASILLRPNEGWAAVIASREAGGAATRRQLGFILLPPVAGGLLLAGMDALRVGPGAAMALLVVLMVVPLAVLILREGRILNLLETERRDQAAELERRLAQQAEALRRESSERIKVEEAALRAQRMEAVGQLTGGIAHDFNNLLMAVGGSLQLLGNRLAPDDPGRRYVDNARAAVAKGAKLTSQLLAFSRTQKLRVRTVELDPILRQARELLGNALGPAIEVQMRLDAAGQSAITDPDQLELAILNLALNAKDAMPDGGSLRLTSGRTRTQLDAEAGAQTASGTASGPRDYLFVQLTDTGEGMPAEVIARAVEPFFTTKERGKGAGLGLARAFGFARQCGGDLRITSQAGVGTTIELLLPQAEPQAERPFPAPAAEITGVGVGLAAMAQAVRGGGQLILVIDDDSSVRTVLVDTLTAAGFQVAEAAGGEEGLRWLNTVTPAAAIIDFVMPGMNGAEVARRIQRILPNLPIIFVSGYFDTVALDGVPGAVVLRKPFDVEGLERAVTSALN